MSELCPVHATCTCACTPCHGTPRRAHSIPTAGGTSADTMWTTPLLSCASARACACARVCLCACARGMCVDARAPHRIKRGLRSAACLPAGRRRRCHLSPWAMPRPLGKHVRASACYRPRMLARSECGCPPLYSACSASAPTRRQRQCLLHRVVSCLVSSCHIHAHARALGIPFTHAHARARHARAKKDSRFGPPHSTQKSCPSLSCRTCASFLRSFGSWARGPKVTRWQAAVSLAKLVSHSLQACLSMRAGALPAPAARYSTMLCTPSRLPVPCYAAMRNQHRVRAARSPPHTPRHHAHGFAALHRTPYPTKCPHRHPPPHSLWQHTPAPYYTRTHARAHRYTHARARTQAQVRHPDPEVEGWLVKERVV